MTDQYAVFGNPIAHSRSPEIHAAFAQQLDQDLNYVAECVDEDKFEARVEAFLEESGKGLNITVPFKLRAFELAQVRSAAAERAGAVNTLWRDADGRINGANTDGIGLVHDLTENAGLNLEGKRILILGAGGAVRGVLEPLLSTAPAEIVIANRTESKAVKLAESFADLGKVRGGGFGCLDRMGAFDVIINGTSASLQGELPPLTDSLVLADTTCYDMMYGKAETPFCRWAREHGAASRDGLGMLVGQAAESFSIWRGVRPATQPVIEQLRQSL